jgi:serine/threonine protein kinase/Tol biopolymer transport system component
MGEVYKARDTRLDRTVAIKVLPAQLASDPDLRQRLEREARAVAALSHPHICPLFDIGRERLRPARGAGVPDAAAALGWPAGGERGEAAPPSASERGWGPASIEEDGVDFLVMEYLEGQTLVERLGKSSLPLDQALHYAIQIADALATAHRAGITHRDLKPGNIFLTKTGAKLLDFGLAKSAPVVAQGFSPANVSASPTMTTPPNLTAQGTILGTFQYMAPEQVEGKEADARTDIFAFGVVLYEMLTGKKAFQARSQMSLMAAILEHDPPPIAASQPLTPPALEHVVKKCLAKNPEDRWQTARDLAGELKWIAESGFRPDVSAAAAQRAHRARWLVAALAIVAFIAALVPTVLYFRRAATESLVTRLDVVTPPTTDPFSFALSPDGRQLAFVANGEKGSQLWVRALDQVSAQPLAGTDGASYPFWAPNSRAIGFFADTKLKRIDLAGGAPQVLGDAPQGRGGTWNRDGIIVFTPSAASGLMRVMATGGSTPVAVTRPTPGQNHRWPQFLPDGRRVLFLVMFGEPQAHGVYLASLDGGDPARVTPGETAAAYAPPGYLLRVLQGVLVAQRFDASHETVASESIPVAQAVAVDDGTFHSAFSVSGGVLAHRAGGASRRQLVWVDRRGKVLGAIGPPDENAPANVSLAPGGQTVAVNRGVQGNMDVWVMDVGRGVESRFTFDTSVDFKSVWSPDGSQVIFQSNRNGAYDLFQKPASGATNEQSLLVSPQDKLPLDWSPDGRLVLYSTQDPKTGSDLWALSLTGERKPFPVVQTSFDEIEGQFSPDGRWIVYASNESGRYEIYLRPFPDSGGKWQVSTLGGIQPRWRRDGRELFYVAPDNRLMAVPIRAASNGRVLDPGAPVALFTTRLASGANIAGAGFSASAQYGVASDGRFLMNVTTDDAAAPPITVVLNWTAGLKK